MMERIFLRVRVGWGKPFRNRCGDGDDNELCGDGWGCGPIYVPMQQQQQEMSELAVVNGGCMGFDKN